MKIFVSSSAISRLHFSDRLQITTTILAIFEVKPWLASFPLVRVARPPIYYGSSRLSALLSHLLDRPYLEMNRPILLAHENLVIIN